MEAVKCCLRPLCQLVHRRAPTRLYGTSDSLGQVARKLTSAGNARVAHAYPGQRPPRTKKRKINQYRPKMYPALGEQWVFLPPLPILALGFFTRVVRTASLENLDLHPFRVDVLPVTFSAEGSIQSHVWVLIRPKHVNDGLVKGHARNEHAVKQLDIITPLSSPSKTHSNSKADTAKELETNTSNRNKRRTKTETETQRGSVKNKSVLWHDLSQRGRWKSNQVRTTVL